MDIIFISELRIETIIGIYDWERVTKQTVSLDLEMATDIRRAAATDRIDDTLNYKAVAKRLIEFVGASDFQLVETLAEKIAAIVLEEFNVTWLRLRLHKPGALRGSRDVGVMIERGTRETGLSGAGVCERRQQRRSRAQHRHGAAPAGSFVRPVAAFLGL